MKNRKSNRALVTGVVAALAASSCCIPPLIALVAGVGGASSSLSWLEPFRPYLIGFAIIALAYAWCIHLKPKTADDCGCEITKPNFYQKRGFLVGMSIFAILSITLPYYSVIFYSDNSKVVVVSNEENLVETNIEIKGMTCDACQDHVDHAVNELDGIVSVKTSYSSGNTIIMFDNTKTDLKEIRKAINSTGYKAIEDE
ncbi:MAG: heavy metal transporter [Kordia sp.]|nr:MAG: heavy metal transporter [Kordia sp.]